MSYDDDAELDEELGFLVKNNNMSEDQADIIFNYLDGKSRGKRDQFLMEFIQCDFENRKKLINELLIIAAHTQARGVGNIKATPKDRDIESEDLKSQGRKWVFTSFLIEKPKFDDTKVGYLIYQKEVCPESKREHWQGYVQLKNKCGFRKVQEILNIGKSFVCRQKASKDIDAIKYCMKDASAVPGSRVICGTPMSPGARTDLSKIKGMIEGGASFLDVLEEDYGTAIRLKNGLLYHKQLVDEKKFTRKRDEKPYVICNFGHVTGCGKTYAAEQIDPSSHYKKSDNSVWWPGYNHENVIILDDFQEKKWDREVILKLLDGGRMQVQTKGGYTDICSKTIVITTNDNPLLWDKALKRRINVWNHMVTPYITDGVDPDEIILGAAQKNGIDIKGMKHGCVDHADRIESIMGGCAKSMELMGQYYLEHTTSGAPLVEPIVEDGLARLIKMTAENQAMILGLKTDFPHGKNAA